MEKDRGNCKSVLELKLESLDMSPRTANCFRREEIHTVGALVALRSTDILKWQNAGKKVLTDIRLLLQELGLTLSDERESLPDERQLSLAMEAQLPTIGAQAEFLEDELNQIVMRVATERNARILVSLWGWNGEAPRTLEAVGRDFSITRERVRQIEQRSAQRLCKFRFDLPLLQRSIDILQNAVPERESALRTKLQQLGLTRCEFGSESVQSAAARLSMNWPFEHIGLGDDRALVSVGEAAKYHNAISLLRKKTSDRGCVNVLSLLSDLQWDESHLLKFRRVLESLSEVVWLDESRDWIYSAAPSRNRLLNICSKVLGVSPRIHLTELRRAVSRSRRLAMCPPQRVLGAFIQRCGLGRIDDSTVIARAGSGLAPAISSAEGQMLSVLDEHGPVLDGNLFAELCVARGMNAITFYIYRSCSPVICPLGKNVYTKVGTDVPPGTIEEIVGKRHVVSRVADQGWTKDGRLWFGTELSRQVITSGGIALSTFVADFVQGEWQVELPDGSNYGTVTCRKLFIWSFRKSLSVLGAEPTDVAKLEFDLKHRRVLVRVGGLGLLEAIQDSESQVPDADFLSGDEV